jgi:hypothetical protein
VVAAQARERCLGVDLAVGIEQLHHLDRVVDLSDFVDQIQPLSYLPAGPEEVDAIAFEPRAGRLLDNSGRETLRFQRDRQGQAGKSSPPKRARFHLSAFPIVRVDERTVRLV